MPSPKTSGLAITSLVLGIASLLCCSIVTGIPAAICGHIARGKIKSDPTLSGGGLALAGLILGYVSIALLPVSAALTLPAVTGALRQAQMTQTLSDARQIHMALEQMAQDGRTAGDPSRGYPADAGIRSVAELKERLVREGYLTAETAEALPFDKLLIGNVSQSDGPDTVVIRTKPEVYPNGALVFIRKEGSGAILTPKQAQEWQAQEPPRSPTYLNEN